MNVENTKFHQDVPKYALRNRKGRWGSFMKLHEYSVLLVFRFTYAKFHQAQNEIVVQYLLFVYSTYLHTYTNTLLAGVARAFANPKFQVCSVPTLLWFVNCNISSSSQLHTHGCSSLYGVYQWCKKILSHFGVRWPFFR